MRAGLLVSALVLLIYAALCSAADKKPGNDAASRVFGLEKVWSMHLTIQLDQWEKMQPKRGGFGFPPNRNAKSAEAKSDGKPAEPKREIKPAEANRDAKVRGMFGFDFPYVKGDLEINGQKFKDVGVRYKGNGSYATSQGRLKRPFKIDLDRYNDGPSFYGQKKLTLNSNSMDPTAAREVLSYIAYRSLDVPASRTAYVKLTLTVPGKYDKEFVGLYTLVETIDKTFLKNHFGSAKGLLLKPEFTAAVAHFGDDWDAYEKRYRPKTPADSKAKRRLIEFTKLVQKADDKTFQEQIGNYLDVDEFLRFLAVTVALVNMDSFIFNGPGHNYLFYLDPQTNKFVILPWDLDLSMGAFGILGSPDEMVDMSIRQPTTNRNRLIERLFADATIYARYKSYLRILLENRFTEESIRKDWGAIHAAIEPIQKQEKAAAAARKEGGNRGGFGGFFNSNQDLPGFTAKRVTSIKEQLDGKRKGTVLAGGFGGPGGFGPGRFLLRPILQAADKDKDGKLSKEEMTAAVKSLFAKLDTEHKGELDQKALTDGINKLLPRPPGFGGPGGPGGPRPGAAGGPRPGAPEGRPAAAAAGERPGAGQGGPGARPGAGPGGPGGRPGFGFPAGGLGGMFARSLIDKVGKDGKVNEERLLTLAEKRFTEADKNKDGKLDDKELIEALNKLMPPFGPPGGRPGAAPAAQKESKREGK